MQISDLDEVLSKVALPARYIGGELNMVKKEEGLTRFLLFFPDLYELGMSNLGFQILYFMLNERDDTFCERAFSPWHDMENEMRLAGIPLYSLETFTPLKDFDIIGVSLQYELSYTNVLNMLDLAKIPIFSKNRGEDFPIIIAGGACAYNPEPLADIIDCFYIGEGEAALNEFMDIYNLYKDGGKRELLKKLGQLEAVYVPSLYDVDYNRDGTVRAVTPNTEGVRDRVKKAFVKDANAMFIPKKLLVPLIEITQGRVVTEIFRGCIRGCRFCQAGFVNRPQREKTVEVIGDTIKALAEDSGYEEVSLMSLSTSDYSKIKELIPEVLKRLCGERVTITLPSLRVDAFSLSLFESLSSMKKTSLTFAPEAGTWRLRNVINKNLTEDEILNGVRAAYSLGYDKIKLYFMAGLPTETYEDLQGITKLCERIVEEYYKMPSSSEKRRRPVSIYASVSYFVPKPHTPFQWDKQAPAKEFIENQKRIKAGVAKKQIRYTYHEADMGVIEGALSRGDRRTAKAVYNAFNSGCRFDGWSEHFDMEKWEDAFKEAGLSLSFYNSRERSYDEVLPWQHIDCGVSKEYLIKEREKAVSCERTPNCREKCGNCGLREACNETETKI